MRFGGATLSSSSSRPFCLHHTQSPPAPRMTRCGAGPSARRAMPMAPSDPESSTARFKMVFSNQTEQHPQGARRRRLNALLRIGAGGTSTAATASLAPGLGQAHPSADGRHRCEYLVPRPRPCVRRRTARRRHLSGGAPAEPGALRQRRAGRRTTATRARWRQRVREFRHPRVVVLFDQMRVDARSSSAADETATRRNAGADVPHGAITIYDASRRRVLLRSSCPARRQRTTAATPPSGATPSVGSHRRPPVSDGLRRRQADGNPGTAPPTTR